VSFAEFAPIFIVLAPGIAAAIAGLGQRWLGDRGAMAITTLVISLSALLAWSQFLGYTFGDNQGPRETIQLAQWISVGQFEANWAIRLDALSITMMAVVTSVSALVHIYSIGYMAEDPHRARFFSYLSLFSFAMLMLVSANDFLQLFFGWEGVGLASYLLIGFWYKKTSANNASIKAFVTNRVGDFGFALGIMAVFLMFGTIEFAPIFEAIKSNAVLTPLALAASAPVTYVAIDFGFVRISMIEMAGILLFIGAMGKSAQFFLHVWLPDAMEGPTPVSALIHAATMVTAGVYLVCLCSPIYENAPIAAAMITLVGAVTAIFAATVGLAQNDIKRVIAYSTCSQLGYMFFAAGIGAYETAMFHLFTHAFFKALLFLGAGSVIHGLHHEQDMRKMGGIWKALPITWVVMILGTLAITGVGIPHTSIGFAGFFSKDAILESTYAASMSGVMFSSFAFWLGVGAALLTSFYSWRLAFFTFHGHSRAGTHSHVDETGSHDDHGHHGDHTPHESPWVMLVPLIVLAFGAVFAGFVFYDPMVGHHAKEFWSGAIYTAPDNTVLKDKYSVPGWVFWAPLVVMITGLVLAVYFYVIKEGIGARIAARGGPLHSLLYNKWFFDEIYEATIVKGLRWLGDTFWKVGDQILIDGGGPNGAAELTRRVSRSLSRLHTGYLYHYAFIILGAAVAFGALVLFRIQGAG
jgi:NADH-quinone oxidoreductase subunit L